MNQRSSRPVSVPGWVATLVAQALGVIPSACHVVPRAPLDHQSNRLYDIWAGNRHLIAKEYLNPDEVHEAPVREFRALQLLAPLDVAPCPVFFDPALGPVIVYKYLEGAMWDRRRPSANELAALADLWLVVGALPTDGLWMSRGYERPWSESRARQHARLQEYAAWTGTAYPAGRRGADICLKLADARHDVIQSLMEIPPVLVFCRSDPRFANIISRPNGQLGMVDWEDSGLRDPARDVADLLTAANQEDLLAPPAWEAFLRPYLAARGVVDPTLTERVHLYLALFPIFWLSLLLTHGVSLARHGKLGGWTINGLPANQRLRRYLARAIAWPDRAFDRQLAGLADVISFPEGV